VQNPVYPINYPGDLKYTKYKILFNYNISSLREIINILMRNKCNNNFMTFNLIYCHIKHTDCNNYNTNM